MKENDLLIEIEHISKVYDIGSEKVFALRDVSLKIHRNEYVAIMGPSGSGKTPKFSASYPTPALRPLRKAARADSRFGPAYRLRESAIAL